MKAVAVAALSLQVVSGKKTHPNTALTFLSSAPVVSFGNPKCPCIGFDNLVGETIATVKDADGKMHQLAYPADLGARCSAWDEGRHLRCGEHGEKPDWCAKQWCYVDPCKCDIDVLPKTAAYIPDATYINRPIYYSYATCGATDSWAAATLDVGSAGCRCIGFDNVPGTTDILIKKKKVTFPAEIGGSCEAWELNKHPDCVVEDPKTAPDWCSQKWCYVDPCSCNLEVPPKVSSYMPDATFQGRTVFYSYATCGGTDSWTATEHDSACVNQKTESACVGLSKCAWSASKGCLGQELVNACGTGNAVKSGAARFAALAALPFAGVILSLVL